MCHTCKKHNPWLFFGLLAPAAPLVFGDEPVQLEEVVVEERSDQMLGIATNATEGVIGAKQLQQRPLLRPGEALENVPGLVVTQHSGSGKANQYFLRGFNLDHGTDFATWVDDMPINMRTHGHGQGYTDLNFMIPELIKNIQFRKGPYYANEGDFSSVGAAHIGYADTLDKNIIQFTGGTYDYYRGLFAGSRKLGQANILAGFESFYYGGPWKVGEDFTKFNGVLRYSQGNEQNGFNISAMGYSGKWTSTDQIPQRAVDQGLISLYGSLDPTDGGDATRYSVSGEWRRGNQHSATHISGYFVASHLNLYNNFTYFLDDPVHGDQFHQADNRTIYGGEAHHTWFSSLGQRQMETTIGLQLRYDDIKLGLFRTQQRAYLSTTSSNMVQELSVSPYIENRVQWFEKFRTVMGVRGDFYHFDVNSNNPLNSGRTNSGLMSPKLNLILGPWYDTEFYLSGGYGFHSNDARGTTLTVDPGTGGPIQKVTPLVRTKGVEAGVRTSIIPNLQSTLSLWVLDIGSELVFSGDAGSTEASRSSRRMGLEWTNFYTPYPWLTLDADISFSRARFRGSNSEGNHIPGAVQTVVAAGIAFHDLPGRWQGLFGDMRLRYFGPRPLIEDNSARSKSTLLVNANLGYEFNKTWKVSLGMFNLLDSRDQDIAYYYTSKLNGEPANGVNDIHFHPVEPRNFRVTLTASF